VVARTDSLPLDLVLNYLLVKASNITASRSTRVRLAGHLASSLHSAREVRRDLTDLYNFSAGSDTRQLVAKSRPNTLLVSTKCTSDAVNTVGLSKDCRSPENLPFMHSVSVCHVIAMKFG